MVSQRFLLSCVTLVSLSLFSFSGFASNSVEPSPACIVSVPTDVAQALPEIQSELEANHYEVKLGALSESTDLFILAGPAVGEDGSMVGTRFAYRISLERNIRHADGNTYPSTIASGTGRTWNLNGDNDVNPNSKSRNRAMRRALRAFLAQLVPCT